MRKWFALNFRSGLLLGCAIAVAVAAAAITYERYDTKTLKRTRNRDAVLCGVNPGLPGFASADEKGNWSGFDVDFCRAVAAAVFDDPRKVWKLSDMDLKSYGRWYDYSRARDAMLRASDTAWAPWFIADTNDKRRGRLNIVTHLLSQVPYEPLEHRNVKLPDRQKAGDYTEPDLPLRHIPTPF